jgi:Ca-activated chloride channel family protein
MWVDGKETAGEMLDAKKANTIYTEIVRRTQDPGLLEYMGNDMMKLRVFPIPPKGDQRLKISYTSIAPREGNVVEYVYPLKTDGSMTKTLEEFSVRLSIKSQHPIQSIYSPTHAIDVKRKGDTEATVDFEKNQALLDKDFQLFYGLGKQDIGLTPLLYRPVTAEDGYFMLLISPQVEALKNARLPRDLVLVLDTSGSMSDLKMSQAKNALKHLLGQLGENDRFGLIRFGNAAQTYEDKLLPATGDQLEKAKKWIGDLQAGGGTNIMDALETATAMRSKESKDEGRTFTVVFFTDGQPTVDERDPNKIVKHVAAHNTASTRIFTFGVGDDVNAVMLDQIAENSKALSTYVRPAEDIGEKAAALNAKISNPVMTNVRIASTTVKLSEMYPPRLPDLFHGSQLVVMGRYSGHGKGEIKLFGKVGKDDRELTYTVDFPARTEDGKEFVEHLWARRKVGFLLDQIRVNGESDEVVKEVTGLAKRYGIATPYTSYLVVPDGPVPVIRQPGDGFPMPVPAAAPGLDAPALKFPMGGGAAGRRPVAGWAKDLAREAEKAGGKGDGVYRNRAELQDRIVDEQLQKLEPAQRNAAFAQALQQAQSEARNLEVAKQNYQNARGDRKELDKNQRGKLGVDLAVASNNLRSQSRVSLTVNKHVYGRTLVDVGGIWVDQDLKPEHKEIVIKAQSDVYFRILQKQPQMKDVFRQGNYLVWITPSDVALVVDPLHGKEQMTDEEIEKLFVAKK